MSMAVKRRGILAAAGAVVAGVLAAQATRHADAAPINGGTDGGALIIGGGGSGCACSPNTTTFGTSLISTNGGFPAFVGSKTGSGGIGIQGQSVSPSGIGVRGQIPSTSSAAGTIAVRADNQSTGATGVGVYATSAKWHGVYAECGTDQGAGALVGVTNFSTGVAFQARANAPAVAAGFFVGNVSVFGSLGVTGGKFAIIKSSDGKYRAMHAVEAPEAWFEDVGKAKLVNGSATVTLDPLFAQHIHTDDYHVFLTEYGESNGLYVTAQDTGGFVVQERNRGTSSVTFGWKVQAKRADLKDERMPVWEVPPGADLPASAPVHAGPQPAPPFRPPQTPASPQGSTPTPGASVSPGVQPAPPPRP
jgi:hypothetical protein